MADQEYEEMKARYFADMEKQSRKRLADATALIAKFTALAASKGVILGAESFEYIQTIGIIAKAQGIARAYWDHSGPSAMGCCLSTKSQIDSLSAAIAKDALPGPRLF